MTKEQFISEISRKPSWSKSQVLDMAYKLKQDKVKNYTVYDICIGDVFFNYRLNHPILIIRKKPKEPFYICLGLSTKNKGHLTLTDLRCRWLQDNYVTNNLSIVSINDINKDYMGSVPTKEVRRIYPV